LQEAHRREKPVSAEPTAPSYPEIEVTEERLAANEELLMFCIYTLVEASLRTPGAIDSDLVAALESLIETHRTLESGLVYETRSRNALAAEIQRIFTRSLEDYTKRRQSDDPLRPVRNSDVLAILVFLHRFGQLNQNGRPRGRMFIDLLRHMAPDEVRVPEQPSSIII
jgi:hypothetical protein